MEDIFEGFDGEEMFSDDGQDKGMDEGEDGESEEGGGPSCDEFEEGSEEETANEKEVSEPHD
jgi:hypothetical protein